MHKETPPIIVEFPLRGEWVAPNTPGKKVPSHGTDVLGQRYAYDFVRTDPAHKGFKFYRQRPLVYLLGGVRLQECYGWGQPIYSPVSGVVVQAHDGWPERQRVHLVRDLAVVLKNARTFDPQQAQDFQRVTGNYLIIESEEAYAFVAHARHGSIRVSTNERVSAGQQIAEVGHSGNSTAPHLHFHLMDNADLRKARGLPCCFQEYEVYRDGTWQVVLNGIPSDTDRIRRM